MKDNRTSSSGPPRVRTIDPGAVSSPPWRLLPIILILAFVGRVGIVFGGDFIFHADVVFQYLEPAWRLLTGEGLVVWEQLYGARSQLIPAALGLILAVLRALGLEHPTALRTAIEVVLCGYSLLIPWGMYAFARRAFDEGTARAALLLGAAWYELAALAGQPLSEMFALAPLLWAFALAANPRSAFRACALGLLLVGTCALRLQYAPLVLYVAVLAWLQLESGLRRYLLGGLAGALASVALFDFATAGWPPYRSYIANLVFNFNFAPSGSWSLAGIGATWYFHAVALVMVSGGLAFAAVIAIPAMPNHQHRVSCIKWLLVPIAIVLAMHAIPAWKEYRHILVAVPLWLMGLAAVLAAVWSLRRGIARSVVALVAGWFIAASTLGLLVELPGQAAAYSRPGTRPLSYIGTPDPLLAFADWLADDVPTGLAEIDLGLSEGIGHFHLGRAVPIYDTGTIAELRKCGLQPRDYASHAIVPPGSPLPFGFEVRLTDPLGWRLAAQSGNDQRHIVPPPWAIPGPVSVSGPWGDAAKRIFEADPDARPALVSLWQYIAGEGDAVVPVGPFRAFGSGARQAPQSRVVLPSHCAGRTDRDSAGR